MAAPRPSSGSPESPLWVTAKVYACVPDIGLVYVRTANDFQYALTPDTAGIRLGDLHEGQTVEGLISSGLARVVSAKLAT